MLLPQKLTERLVTVGSDLDKWVSASVSDISSQFRLHETLPKCCLPNSLGGDVPDENGDHFYEFCKEKSKLIEERYKYLDIWSNQEASF